MPREPRRIVAGEVYHLISRFVDRQWFVRTSDEREHYLRLLGRAVADSNWRCFGYGVMSNHIHVEALAGTEPLSTWIRRVHSPFAGAVNKAHERIGPVFVRGPKAFLVPKDKIGRVLAYIHNNPVRAGVVASPGDTDWTSHRAYIGMASVPRWLHVDEALERAAISATDFDSWVRGEHRGASEKSEEEVFDALELEEAVETPVEAPIDAQQLVEITAAALGLSLDSVRSRRRQAQHVLARRVVAVSGDRLGLSGASIARALRTSPQCVSRILTATNGLPRPELVEHVIEAARTCMP